MPEAARVYNCHNFVLDYDTKDKRESVSIMISLRISQLTQFFKYWLWSFKKTFYYWWYIDTQAFTSDAYPTYNVTGGKEFSQSLKCFPVFQSIPRVLKIFQHVALGETFQEAHFNVRVILYCRTFLYEPTSKSDSN